MTKYKRINKIWNKQDCTFTNQEYKIEVIIE